MLTLLNPSPLSTASTTRIGTFLPRYSHKANSLLSGVTGGVLFQLKSCDFYRCVFALYLVLFSITSVQADELKPAPDFTLPTKSGTISLSSLKGKVVYVDFWATWCVPCRKSFPWMNEMQTKFGTKQFAIVAINLDRDQEFIEVFLKKYPANFTVAFDQEGTVADKYGLVGMPSSYLIDKKGKIVLSHTGFREEDKAKLEAEFAKLLTR